MCGRRVSGCYGSTCSVRCRLNETSVRSASARSSSRSSRFSSSTRAPPCPQRGSSTSSWRRGARRGRRRAGRHVSHLRRALPGAALVSTSAGYRLDIPPDAVDAYRFERWCREARSLIAADEPDLTERGTALLADALALWRGPAFADVADRPWALPRIAQLDAGRRAARRDYAEALSALGRHAEAVGQLSGAVVDDPYDEEVRRLLALALFAERRVDEAAEVCREGLVLLRARGLDAPELAELQRDVLRRRLPRPRRPGDPTSPSAMPAAAEPPQFVGRTAELAEAGGSCPAVPRCWSVARRASARPSSRSGWRTRYAPTFPTASCM